MSQVHIAGCLACGAIGDVCFDEIKTANCYGCGESGQFMVQKTPGDEMDAKFIEDFLTARLQRTELK